MVVTKCLATVVDDLADAYADGGGPSRAFFGRRVAATIGWSSFSVAAITSEEFPGERRIVCRNPLLAAERQRKRQSSGNGCRRGSRKRDRCPRDHEAHENRPQYLALHLCRTHPDVPGSRDSATDVTGTSNV